MSRVQIFQVARVTNAKSPYRVKWRVAGHDKTRAFKKKALADKFQRDLHAALDRGEHFSSITGEPESLVRTEVTFAACAASYVADNYTQWESASRRTSVQALTHSVLFLCRSDKFPFDRALMADVVRRSLLKPNQPAPTDVKRQQALNWIMKNSIPLQDLSTDLLQSCLAAMSKSLDGKEALSPSTLQKRRQALNASLEFGVSKKNLYTNPLKEVKVKIKLDDEAINPKTILTPKECRELQEKVSARGKLGILASVFFACMWLAGLRPSEVAALRPRDIHLSETENESEIVVSRAIVEVGKLWTDAGTTTVTKQPKARRRGHSRSVPIPEDLVKVLMPYIKGMEPDDLIFPGPRSKDKQQPISLSAIEAKWAEVRTTNHKLYDLRHTNATLLIYSGLNVAVVAACLGHSIAVCSRVYLGVFNDHQKSSIAKVNQFLANS